MNVFPPPGGYVAVDYDKRGHPSLTSVELASIRTALSIVKPCQRPLVRYAYGNSDTPIFLYFAVGPQEGAKVFGTALVYDPSNDTGIPMSDITGEDEMVKQGIQWDVDHQPCPSPSPH
jgi:hypothetical protein